MARSRIVIASPHAAERDTIAAWLSSEGFEPVRASTAPGTVDVLRGVPFDLLISDYDFAFRDGVYAAARGKSRTPIVVVGDVDAAAQSRVESRGASYVPRPAERTTLLCIISMALMDDRPVRRSARKPVNRFEAAASGTPCYLIDVSNEGLRLELPRERRSSPPPYFNVRVPLIGATMMVQRVWITAPGGSPKSDSLWCGAALAQNSLRTEHAWRSFVDALPTRASDSIRVQK
jgi:CheY-like chemotaxis protein